MDAREWVALLHSDVSYIVYVGGESRVFFIQEKRLTTLWTNEGSP